MASDALAGCTMLHGWDTFASWAGNWQYGYGYLWIKLNQTWSKPIYIYIIYDTIFFDDPCNLYDSWSFTLTILMITGAPGFLSPCRCLTMSSGSNTKRIRSSLVVHIVFVWREVLISDGKRCSNGLKDTIRYLLYSLSNIQNLNKNNLLVASEF